MKKNSKIQDFKTKMSNAQIITRKSLKSVKGGSDPPPFGGEGQAGTGSGG